jgi:hypothetical protein
LGDRCGAPAQYFTSRLLIHASETVILLSENNLREMDEAASRITIQGARYRKKWRRKAVSTSLAVE